MNELKRTKLIIYFILGIMVLGLLGLLTYSRFTTTGRKPTPKGPGITGRLSDGRPTPTEKRPEKLNLGEEFPVAAGQKLIKITDFSVVSPSLNKEENKILYYKKDGGNLYSSDFSGQKQEKISNLTIVGILEALWSPARDRAAVFYLDQETLKGFLHIGTSSVAILPQNLKSFSWSPDGKSLSYLIFKDDRLNLVSGDSAAKNIKNIFSTPVLDAQISWVSADKIAMQTAPSGAAEGFIFLYSRASGSFQKILGAIFGLTSLWSPDSSRILISSTNSAGRNLRLAVTDTSGKILFNSNLATLPEKCTWADNKEIYCALPRDISTENIWPDEYLRGEVNTTDSLVKVNIEKKEIEGIFTEEGFDVSSLILSKDKNYLFFINRVDGTLWSLKIK